jgi:hypothetical protein
VADRIRPQRAFPSISTICDQVNVLKAGSESTFVAKYVSQPTASA